MRTLAFALRMLRRDARAGELHLLVAALVIAAAVLWLVAAVLVPAALVKFCWLYLMR